MKNWGHRPGCWNFDDEKLVALGMKWPIEGRVHMVPAWSPDLHQVIEHAHGNTCRKFHEWLDDHHEEDPRSSVYCLEFQSHSSDDMSWAGVVAPSKP
jgi:hypothetical protein